MDLPRHKSDLETALSLQACSLDELAPYLAELLVWFQDFNWPVAQRIAPILARSDARIVPHIRAVLDGDDDVWKYWVLDQLVSILDSSVRAALLEDVQRIIDEPTPGELAEEVHLVASDVMDTHRTQCASP